MRARTITTSQRSGRVAREVVHGISEWTVCARAHFTAMHILAREPHAECRSPCAPTNAEPDNGAIEYARFASVLIWSLCRLAQALGCNAVSVDDQTIPWPSTSALPRSSRCPPSHTAGRTEFAGEEDD